MTDLNAISIAGLPSLIDAKQIFEARVQWADMAKDMAEKGLDCIRSIEDGEAEAEEAYFVKVLASAIDGLEETIMPPDSVFLKAGLWWRVKGGA